jgi:hypothetical protein
MAIHVFVLVLIALLGVVVVASALAFWTQSLQWAEASLFPWVERNLPFLADSVRQAFVELDRVAVPLRLLARRAWATVRERLLKMTVTIERHSDNEWVHRVTSWVVKIWTTARRCPSRSKPRSGWTGTTCRWTSATPSCGGSVRRPTWT